MSSYWTNYRKIRKEPILAQNKDAEVFIPDPPVVNMLLNTEESEIDDDWVEPDNFEENYISSSDDMLNDDEFGDDLLDNEEGGVGDLGSELAQWSVKNNITRSALDEILVILRRHGNNLPKDSRTLRKASINVSVESKCGGQYIYFELKDGITNFIKKLLSRDCR